MRLRRSPFNDELQHHRNHDRDRESRIASDQCDRETDCGTDNEIAELHREPQRPVQPIGKMIHRSEHALLLRRDLGAARPGERSADHDEPHGRDRERAPVNRHPWIMPRILRSKFINLR